MRNGGVLALFVAITFASIGCVSTAPPSPPVVRSASGVDVTKKEPQSIEYGRVMEVFPYKATLPDGGMGKAIGGTGGAIVGIAAGSAIGGLDGLVYGGQVGASAGS